MTSPNIPKIGKKLQKQHVALLTALATSCRHSIIDMLKSSQSGHPGGSLSAIDYLTTLYAYIISQTGEPVIVSNGHISPAVYAILAELGYISKSDVVAHFRKAGHPYEGHVTRHVPGIWYGTGPLGTGISAASGFALGEKLQDSGKKVFGILGDGEAEEGQVYEMMNFAAKYRLNNFIAFMDYNQVQLSDSLAHIMPFNPKKIFLAGGWEVIEFNGHDYDAIWGALSRAYSVKNKPVLLLGKTIMGRGVDFMEKTGRAHQADWHGKAPKPAEADVALKQLILNDKQTAMLKEFKKLIVWKPKKPVFTPAHAPLRIKTGAPKVYAADIVTDCRSAYGAALLDLARLNNNVLAMTADLADSVKTDGVRREFPLRHIECGIAEQQMVSAAGGLSLDGFIPFASTFGAFMTSRAKDQARVNDINLTNVKMVATHCGLSVGEDGPTHQAIDDMGSMIGLLHTSVIEPADPNHCDRIIRYVASHYGNYYVRMGRHKIPVLTREDGSVFFDASYEYHYGRCDVLRSGTSLTMVATGATVAEALKARELLQSSHPGHSIEIVIASSIKHFDDTLTHSIRKTKKVVTVEDHNVYSGLGNQIARHIVDNQLSVDSIHMLGVREYELSGTAEALYDAAGISAKQIATTIEKMFTS